MALSADELDRVADDLMEATKRSSIFAAISLALQARHLRRRANQLRAALESKDTQDD